MTDPTPTIAAQIEALAPCPFCGGEAQLEHLESGSWSPGCIEAGGEPCVAFQMLSTYPTQREAIAAWNTRPAIVTALRQAEAAPGVVEAAARLINPAAWDRHDEFKQIIAGDYKFPDDPKHAEMCRRSAARRVDTVVSPSLKLAADILALARQHGAREGMVMVPREPTKEIITAMARALHSEYFDDCFESIDMPLARSAYAAMIAAAPATDAGEGK